MIKQKYSTIMALFMVAASLMILTSCNIIVRKDQLATDMTGTGGLTLTLPKIPASLYPGQGLEIPIILENTGTHNIENAILAISGYDEENIMFSSPTKYEGINLEGRTEFVPIGEKTTEIFTIGKIALPNAKEKLQVFNILACYQYKTEASPLVCINPQWAYSGSTQGCHFSEAQITSSQGAPVAVSRVVTSYFESRKEVQFDIFVKDVSGKGVVLAPSAYAKPCLGSVSLEEGDQGTVMMEAYLSGEKLRCYSATSDEISETFTISTQGDTYAARCKASIETNKPAYTTPLSVYLTYGYASGKTFQLTIKNPSFVG